MFSKVIVLCLGLILAALLRQRTDPDIFLHVKLNSSYDYIIGKKSTIVNNACCLHVSIPNVVSDVLNWFTNLT